ncbi:30S ribosome-binding factor RbfA [unidentified bacterial endosymbiont]|uniref:30S ribosome-binding factor RbfA n=1 Tax=unidentified bacterial endosymbiont TaxID=2355 RepID=UPI0020A1CD7D|nr:30S ribosome-binding factor RbfA [unidentified bacterial endosymbiont]
MVIAVSRPQRVAQALQKELAVILQRDVRNPRIGTVSLMGVEVSRDLAHAKVFVTFFEQPGDTARIQQGLAALQQAGGFIRSRLGKTLRLRLVPALHFFHDPSLANGLHITQLLAQVIKPALESTLDAVLEPSADEE